VKSDWSRSDTIALAKESCTQCQGLGLRNYTRREQDAPCNCVLRAIFRACYNRFRHCIEKEKYMSHVRIQIVGANERRQVWGRRDEEYLADFYLVSKRYLDEEEFRIFRFHFLLGADWKLCARRLKMDRGTFFHTIYKIQQKLGRVFKELQPYALFPLDEYFGGAVRQDFSLEARKVLEMPLRLNGRKLRPPLRKVA
jgi:hypothetical protein